MIVQVGEAETFDRQPEVLACGRAEASLIDRDHGDALDGVPHHVERFARVLVVERAADDLGVSYQSTFFVDHFLRPV